MTGAVVTGTGVITAAGHGPAPVLDAMLDGKSLFTHPSWLPWPVADMRLPEIAWPDGDPWVNNQKYASAVAHAAVAAARLAVDAVGGPVGEHDGLRCGTVLAAGISGGDELNEVIPKLAVLAETDPRPLTKLLYDEVPDYSYLRGIPSQVGQFVCMAAGFLGSNVAVYGESGAGGLGALSVAVRLLDSGELDRVLVVGVQPPMSTTVLAALDRAEPFGTGAGPFDRRRDGTLIGEGAAAVMLERADTARRRGAHVIAEVAACETVCAGSRTDALRAAATAVLTGAPAPDLWWAHGCGSVATDADECRTVAPLVPGVPVTASKGTVGNAFECAALIDLTLAAEALERGVVPPVGRLDELDPRLGAVDVVQGEPRRLPGGRGALVTSFSAGPHATTAGAALVVKGTPS
ncbi:beta-ketoacyl synthase N-terminal-like domain-containing protein [Streptomyces acidiscabies]|uniref:beta-ketoacyl synthase N-terminal-like domain-containing protein n=1 Tax=Streptomyces acidiscabies TaxID=42234 RepID=UPI0038F60DF2